MTTNNAYPSYGQKSFQYANVQAWSYAQNDCSELLLPCMEHYYGYRVFRTNQKAIINATLAGRDVFVCMPTGGGKSLTF